MTVTWYGNTCFSIHQKTGSEERVLLLNPADRTSRARTLEERADVLVVQNPEAPLPKTRDGKFLIHEPGEYEVGNFRLRAIPFSANKHLWHIMLLLHAEGMSLVHLDDFARGRLSDEELEDLGGVDILLLSFGKTLDASQAAGLVQQLEPRIVVPAPHERVSGKIDKASKAFLKELGVGASEALARVHVKKKELPQEEMRVVLLTPQ